MIYLLGLGLDLDLMLVTGCWIMEITIRSGNNDKIISKALF